MADDQSDASGMMQAVVEEDTSEMLIADLGTVTKAPNIRNRNTVNDTAQDLN